MFRADKRESTRANGSCVPVRLVQAVREPRLRGAGTHDLSGRDAFGRDEHADLAAGGPTTLKKESIATHRYEIDLQAKRAAQLVACVAGIKLNTAPASL